MEKRETLLISSRYTVCIRKHPSGFPLCHPAIIRDMEQLILKMAAGEQLPWNLLPVGIVPLVMTTFFEEF